MNGVLAGSAILIILVILAAAVMLKHRDAGPNTQLPNSAAGGKPGTRKITDRKSMWAKRYGAGHVAWGAAAWTAGAGLTFDQAEDAAREHKASCGGSAGAVGGTAGCGAGDGGVGCNAGGCGGGCSGGCGGGCGGN